MSARLFIEKGSPGHTACLQCHRQIAVPSLCVVIAGAVMSCYHLGCFTRCNLTPLCPGVNIETRGVTDPKEIAKITAWIDAWNRRFVENVPDQFLRQAVLTHSPSMRRSLLEVFTYLSLSEIELSVAVTSKAWFHVTRDEELWKSRFILEFSASETHSDTSYRHSFISMRLNSCWHCKAFVPLANIAFKCPIRRRPLCTVCSSTKECTVLPLTWYCNCHALSARLPQHLKFRTYMQHGVVKGYVSDFAAIMIPYAERRREKLLNLLEAEYAGRLQNDTIEMIQQINIDAFYKDSGGAVHVPTALARFLGRWKKRETLEISVKEFVDEIKEYENIRRYRTKDNAHSR